MNIARLLAGLLVMLYVVGWFPGSASAIPPDPCDSSSDVVAEDLYLGIACPDGQDGSPGVDGMSHEAGSVSVGRPVSQWVHRWAAICGSSQSAQSPEGADACGVARACPVGPGILASHWVRELRLVGDAYVAQPGWEAQGTECITFDPEDPPAAVARPQITWAMVLREVKRVGLPALAVRVQPAGRTLVNFETIFYTEPEPFERELRLLGQRVEVRATAVGFGWSFGDGAGEQTRSPGAPYPDQDVVHEYVDADVTVAPRVDVTYAAEFRVNGGAWQEIPESVTIAGPPTRLRVLEATAVLVGGD